MKPHVEGMMEVTQTDYENTERLLNAHMSAWSTILGAKERVANNFQSKNNMIPPLYGLRKDHKKFDDENKGPPTRPVCGAVVASNYRISYFLSMLIRPLIRESPDVCDSTEDLLSRVRECNENSDLEQSILGSMDVEALYPSIDITFAVEKCQEMIAESDLELKHVDVDELGLFLALTTTTEELQEHNLKRYCPLRSNKGRAPTLTPGGYSLTVNTP